MSSDWPSVRIEEIAAAQPSAMATGPFGSSISAKFFQDSGVPVIRGSNLSADVQTKIDDTGLVFVSEDKAQEFPRCIVGPGDLVFTCWGTINQVGLIDSQARFKRYLISNKQMKLTVDRTKADPRFVYYVFSGPIKQSEIIENGIGSSVPGFNLGQLRKHSFSLPPLKEQQAIADFLDLFTDRIALLRETNTTLEAIAQALFKSWFVDFEPVHAKARGEQPQGMDDATAALFPDSFEESELGMIPKGWQVKSFGEFVTRQSVGKKYDQKSALPEGLIPILDQGKSGIIGFHNDEPGVRASLDNPVVVFANHTCYMRLITFDFSAIQNVLPFIGKGIDTVWAFYATKDRVKFSEYKGHWPDFAIEKAVIPDDHLTFAFRNIVDSIVRGMRSNEQQAQTLAQLRDTLLPKLISGQLRLPEAEELLAEELP